MKITLWRALGLFVSTSAMFATALAGASAAAPPEGGEGEETGNNLSVPTIMVNGSFTDVNCPVGVTERSGLLTPSGDPTNGFEIDPTAYYYVQGTNIWQAQCYTAVATRVTGAWGDNLGGSADLSTKHPIRVELALYNAADWRPAMDGYVVEKLEPSLLDRNSAYGTLATGNGQTYEATPTQFTYDQQRVYDGEAKFWIKYLRDGTYVVKKGTALPAEINATGNVVYGYNLRVSEPGSYAIRIRVPSVKVTGVDIGSFKDHVVRLVIKVK